MLLSALPRVGSVFDIVYPYRFGSAHWGRSWSNASVGAAPCGRPAPTAWHGFHPFKIMVSCPWQPRQGATTWGRPYTLRVFASPRESTFQPSATAWHGVLRSRTAPVGATHAVPPLVAIRGADPTSPPFSAGHGVLRSLLANAAIRGLCVRVVPGGGGEGYRSFPPAPFSAGHGVHRSQSAAGRPVSARRRQSCFRAWRPAFRRPRRPCRRSSGPGPA